MAKGANFFTNTDYFKKAAELDTEALTAADSDNAEAANAISSCGSCTGAQASQPEFDPAADSPEKSTEVKNTEPSVMQQRMASGNTCGRGLTKAVTPEIAAEVKKQCAEDKVVRESLARAIPTLDVSTKPGGAGELQNRVLQSLSLSSELEKVVKDPSKIDVGLVTELANKLPAWVTDQEVFGVEIGIDNIPFQTILDVIAGNGDVMAFIPVMKIANTVGAKLDGVPLVGSLISGVSKGFDAVNNIDVESLVASGTGFLGDFIDTKFGDGEGYAELWLKDLAKDGLSVADGWAAQVTPELTSVLNVGVEDVFRTAIPGLEGETAIDITAIQTITKSSSTNFLKSVAEEQSKKGISMAASVVSDQFHKSPNKTFVANSTFTTDVIEVVATDEIVKSISAWV